MRLTRAILLIAVAFGGGLHPAASTAGSQKDHTQPPAAVQTLEEARAQFHGDISALELLRQEARNQSFLAPLERLNRIKNSSPTRETTHFFSAIKEMREKEWQRFNLTNSRPSSSDHAALLQVNLEIMTERMNFIQEIEQLSPTFLEMNEKSRNTLLHQSLHEAKRLTESFKDLPAAKVFVKVTNLADLIHLLVLTDRPGLKKVHGLVILPLYFALLTLGGAIGSELHFTFGGLIGMYAGQYTAIRLAEKWDDHRVSKRKKYHNQLAQEIHGSTGNAEQELEIDEVVNRLRELARNLNLASCTAILTP